MPHKAFDKFDLTGRTAVVTAGATGLGYYMARGLARSGAKVLIAQRRDDVVSAAAEQLREESGGEVLHDTVDLGDRASIKAFAQRALEALGGRVDIFVGNAAQLLFEPVDVISDDTIDQAFQVNVSSNIELMRAFLPGMRQQRWGRIIFSSSTTSIAAAYQEHQAAYIATKGALNSLTRAIAVETGADGITCNAIVLGLHMTELFQSHVDALEEAQGKDAVRAFTDSFSSMIPVGRIGRPDEVEGVVQFLASQAGSYITGSNLVADGGMAVMLRPNTPPAEPVYPPAY
jgi:NAD(P)-dependent dehydrogenase (short-subunit alcohol dehydrogenase family)